MDSQNSRPEDIKEPSITAGGSPESSQSVLPQQETATAPAAAPVAADPSAAQAPTASEPPSPVPPAVPAAHEPKGGSGVTVLLIIVAVVVVLAVAIGAAVFYFSSMNKGTTESTTPQHQSAPAEKSEPSPALETDAAGSAPATPDELDRELEMLDKTFNDGAEESFDVKTLDAIAGE
ncbi:MAG: hypothetical protein N2691_05180 [Patescibacteria group bacterium]|nr:hypothetical protein [Patescibacteria group bacterium]